MDSSTWGKVLRITLIAFLASIIAITLALIGVHIAVSLMDTSSYIDYSIYEPLAYRIVSFLPICTLSIISIVFISLQTKRILALEKIVMKADDIPNSYRFTPPNTTKSKKPFVIKILIISVLALISLVSMIGAEGAIIRIILEIISNPNVPKSQEIYFALNIITMVLYALLFAFISISAILGGACIFIGGRSSHVNELEKVLIQKSNFAELRAQEENDELDELSQIF